MARRPPHSSSSDRTPSQEHPRRTMKSFTILSLAACLPLGSVKSFQIAPRPTVGVTKKIAAITHAAAAVRPRSSAPSSSSLSLSLEEIQQQFTEITESFAQAKKRQDEAREKADLIREEKSGVVSETDMAIDRLKRDLRYIIHSNFPYFSLTLRILLLITVLCVSSKNMTVKK